MTNHPNRSSKAKLIVGKEAIFDTSDGLAVPVSIDWFQGPRNQQARVTVLRDTFDTEAGYNAGTILFPVPRSSLRRAGTMR